MMMHPVTPAIACNKSFAHNFEAISDNVPFANFDIHAFGCAGTYLTLIRSHQLQFELRINHKQKTTRAEQNKIKINVASPASDF